MMTTIQLHYNKRKIRLKVKQMHIYKQAKIVEIIGKSNQTYLLFFYKKDFINAKKTPSIKLQSFLHNTLKYGECYPADHPLTQALLATTKDCRFISIQQMIQKLNKNYNETEKLYILSMFDNYLEEKKLRALVKKRFYDYRRSGQMKKAFRFIINYAELRRHDPFARDIVQHFDFQHHKQYYQNIDQLILDWSDPQYMESYYFKKDFPEDLAEPLLKQYEKDNRIFDRFYLLYKTEKNMELLDQLAQTLLTEQSQLALWEELLKHTSDTGFVLRKLAAVNGFEVILHYLLRNPAALKDRELTEKMIQSVSGRLLAEHYASLLSQLISMKNSFSDKMIKHMIKKILPYVTPDQILHTVKDTELPIIQKLRKAAELHENPDKQFKLGEIYFELEQFDLAIDCFEWEMELAPQASAPIHYLYQCYLAKGDKEQANSYKKLMASIPS